MALKFKVQGLGKIENAEINISPLTVITGPNGTGKSFFTKMAYSIFRLIEDVSLTKELIEDVELSIECIESVLEKENIDPTLNIVLKALRVKLLALFQKFELSLTHREFHFTSDSFEVDIKALQETYDEVLSLKSKIDDKEINSELSGLATFIEHLFIFFDGIAGSYNVLINKRILGELQDNYQVDRISDLMSKETLTLELEGFYKLTGTDSLLDFEVQDKAISVFKSKPNSVFFESPAYWRVRDALVSAKMKSGDGYLSGVPKYFFDLDSDLRKKSKVESELLPIYEAIKSELAGEFIFEGSDISFKDATLDKKISKNLVSFGMTNLGMLNALIKNNVIKKGSYVFIDEPETNLHPDWQVLMIKVLTELSRAEVNVIITTHSTEILKYIEVRFQAIKEEEGEERVKELLSVNYLDTDGTSLEFDSECPIEQTKEALSELSSPFFDLYMERK
ncbi:AAA family ATPase [Vibrio coralliilyticus OCN008]|uniref:AAA family ATPase n=1 Tax=Vibrio coralliilyticus TaxID=190893 RepID=UPI0013F48B2F|nr:AAA family ATPase [Vibrio coralliilyticus]QIJ87142.1 AAA family ATPase [Vibrio coralliilyticus OCN008]